MTEEDDFSDLIGEEEAGELDPFKDEVARLAKEYASIKPSELYRSMLIQAGVLRGKDKMGAETYNHIQGKFVEAAQTGIDERKARGDFFKLMLENDLVEVVEPELKRIVGHNWIKYVGEVSEGFLDALSVAADKIAEGDDLASVIKQNTAQIYLAHQKNSLVDSVLHLAGELLEDGKSTYVLGPLEEKLNAGCMVADREELMKYKRDVDYGQEIVIESIPDDLEFLTSYIDHKARAPIVYSEPHQTIIISREYLEKKLFPVKVEDDKEKQENRVIRRVIDLMFREFEALNGGSTKDRIIIKKEKYEATCLRHRNWVAEDKDKTFHHSVTNTLIFKYLFHNTFADIGREEAFDKFSSLITGYDRAKSGNELSTRCDVLPDEMAESIEQLYAALEEDKAVSVKKIKVLKTGVKELSGMVRRIYDSLNKKYKAAKEKEESGKRTSRLTAREKFVYTLITKTISTLEENHPVLKYFPQAKADLQAAELPSAEYEKALGVLNDFAQRMAAPPYKDLDSVLILAAAFHYTSHQQQRKIVERRGLVAQTEPVFSRLDEFYKKFEPLTNI